MDPFFSDLDALWTLAALVPLGVAAAAWALQMSCGFCSVEPPEFWHAVTTVVIIAVANVRAAVRPADDRLGLWHGAAVSDAGDGHGGGHRAGVADGAVLGDDDHRRADRAVRADVLRAGVAARR